MRRAIGQALSRLLDTVPRLSLRNPENPAALRFQRRCAALLAEPVAIDTSGSSSDAFVIQGPLVDATPHLIAVLRRLYPRETIVVSTWDSSDEALLREIRPLCNAVVLSAPPPTPGGSNRNYQIASTSAGIAKAGELGAGALLKMRTDTCLLTPGLFALYRATSAGIDDSMCRARGLRGRMFVPQTYTKKYFPFHVSDILMLGHTDDLARYWKLPADDRELSLDAYSWGSQSLERIGMEGLLPETYLGVHFAESVHALGNDTLADYWSLLRDYFVVVDDSWFDLYWLKRPVYLQPRAVDELVNHAFWLALYHGIEIDPATWQAELAQARREGATFTYNSAPAIPARK